MDQTWFSLRPTARPGPEAAHTLIAEHPAAVSPRYAYELALPELRSHGLKRYPYRVFHAERDDHINVWRVLHTRLDAGTRSLTPGQCESWRQIAV
jgi:hypothetical protein